MTRDDADRSGDDAGRSGDASGGGEGARAVDAPNRSGELPESAKCPFCGTRETEQFSSFGSAVSTSQYYCNRCRTVFEFMKWRGG